MREFCEIRCVTLARVGNGVLPKFIRARDCHLKQFRQVLLSWWCSVSIYRDYPEITSRLPFELGGYCAIYRNNYCNFAALHKRSEG